MLWKNKKKITIEECNGGKLDRAIISTEEEANDLVKRWKLKGLLQ